MMKPRRSGTLKGNRMHDTLWSTAKKISITVTSGIDGSTTENPSSLLEMEDPSMLLALAQPSVYKSSSMRKKGHGDDVASHFSVDRMSAACLDKLYGRDREIATLQKQWRATQELRPTRQMALIHGGAGVGKSTLPHRVLKPMADFYLTGKFDMQKTADEPYSAIAAACQILCQDLLCHQDCPVWESFTFPQFQSKLSQQFDSYSIDILRTIVPGIEELHPDWCPKEETPFSTTEDQDNSGNYTQSKQSLQNAFAKFIALLVSFGSVILVLDDIQWADQASLELLQVLALDTDETSTFMMVATYRTENATDQGLKNFLNQLPGSYMEIITYQLNGLTETDLIEMLQDLLSLPSDQDMQALASCIHTKTDGNPFFLRQFLHKLQGDGLLTFQITSHTWRVDVAEIQAASLATDNVVSLLVERIQKLPTLIHAILLPRIAFLGTRFLQSLVELVMEMTCTPEEVEQAVQEYNRAHSKSSFAKDVLMVCQNEGLLVETSITGRPPSWKWVHDKVQEAAVSLAQGEKRAEMQFELGVWLLQKLSPSQLAASLFVVTNLVNTASEPPKDCDMAISFAHLNLRSGTAAFGASAFSMANEYFEKGISTLTAGRKWDNHHHQLSLDLYSGAAEACFCIGKFEQSKRYAKEVLENSGESTTLLQKKRAYNVLIHATSGQGYTRDAMHLVLDVLRQLGCKFPKYGKDVFTVAGVIGLLSSVDKTVDLIDKQQPMVKEDKIWGMYLLDRLVTYSYQCNDKVLALAVMKALRWTVHHGTCEMTGPLIATVAMTVAALGDFAGAKKYADVALQYMTTRSKARTIFILYALVLHYQTPLELSKKPFLEGYQAGMTSGDIESACWCLVCFLEHQYLAANRSLSVVLQDCDTYNRQIEKHMSNMIAYVSRHLWQFMLNLHDPKGNKHILIGSVVSEEEYNKILKESEGGPSTYEQHQLNRYRVQAAFWFNEHKLVVELMEFDDYQNFGLDKHFPSCYYNAMVHSWCALSCISVARIKPKAKYKLKQWAKKLLKKIKDWVKKGNPNCQTHESLIEAELASLDGSTHLAKKHYEVAILLAGRWGHLNDHALAYERHADHCLRLGNNEEASYNYKRALTMYREWGAEAKAELIELEHAELVNPVPIIVLGGEMQHFSRVSIPTMIHMIHPLEQAGFGSDRF